MRPVEVLVISFCLEHVAVNKRSVVYQAKQRQSLLLTKILCYYCNTKHLHIILISLFNYEKRYKIFVHVLSYTEYTRRQMSWINYLSRQLQALKSRRSKLVGSRGVFTYQPGELTNSEVLKLGRYAKANSREGMVVAFFQTATCYHRDHDLFIRKNRHFSMCLMHINIQSTTTYISKRLLLIYDLLNAM